MPDQQYINTLKERADLVEYVAQEVKLKKQGTSHKGCCPFHDEKTPSFSVYVKNGEQRYKCFGCDASGDIYTWLQERKQLDFIEAAKLLAQDLNEPWPDDHIPPEVAKARKSEKELTQKLLNHAAQHFQRLLDAEPDDSTAKKYLSEKLKYPAETLAQYGIGYTGPGTLLKQPWLAKKSEQELATKIGLLRKDENGTLKDYLYNRVTFAIQGRRGPIGFAGRDLNPDTKIKWINPPTEGNPVYDKSTVLYGYAQHAQHITKAEYAVLVEGYTDVITPTLQQFYLCVASCGTAFTPGQATALSKITKRVVIMYDGDEAGAKATWKAIPILLEAGLTVSVCRPPVDEDPDSMCQAGTGIAEYIKDEQVDAITWAKDELLPPGTDPHPAKLQESVNTLVGLLAHIEAKIMRDAYLTNMAKDKRLKRTLLNEALDDALDRQAEDTAPKSTAGVTVSIDRQPKLPKECGRTWDEVEQYVLKYHLFMGTDKRIYYASKDQHDQYYFWPLSNFTISILQHMKNTINPERLVRLQNTEGDVSVFTVKAEVFAGRGGFANMLEQQGNYQLYGNNTHYIGLQNYLKDHMGVGEMVETMGWQPKQRIHIFHNAYFNGQMHPIDGTGTFEHKGYHFYIPGANKYQNAEEFEYQKHARLDQAEITITQLCTKMRTVHRDNGLVGFAFALATAFSDHIYSIIGGFPILFNYGDASTGKGNMTDACMRLFGKVIPKIKFTGTSTEKGKMLTFAQMRNMIVGLEEFRNVPGKITFEEFIKGGWDRIGYVRGRNTSKYGSENIPINCTIAINGNEHPVEPATISRCIFLHYPKRSFTDADKDEYNKLQEWVRKGYSSLLGDILAHRDTVEAKLPDMIKHWRSALGADLKEYREVEGFDRMLNNAVALLSAYDILRKPLELPYETTELKYVLKESIIFNCNIIDTEDTVRRWWDCMVQSVKEKRLQEGYHFKVDGYTLIFNFESAYRAYLQSHRDLFIGSDTVPMGKNTMRDKLKRSPGFKRYLNGTYWQNSKRNTSAYEFDMEAGQFIEQMRDIYDYVDEENHPKENLVHGNGQQGTTNGDLPTEEDDLPF